VTIFLAGVTIFVTPFLFALGGAGADGSRARRAPGDRLEWGVYQIYWGASRFEGILGRELGHLASEPNYVMFYRDMGRGFPKGGIEVIRRVGATPIISLELWRWHDRGTKQLPRIVDGAWDDFFRAWAKDAKEDGGRVLLRFGFEFNGDWFGWGGDPEGFVNAWRRAWKIFDEVGAKNVEWVWAANITSHPATPENSMHAYYPGDAYVDWVAVDGYNWGDDYREWHKWTSFEGLFEPVLHAFAKKYPSKPVMIAEFGSPEGEPGKKAKWIREAHAYLSRRDQVRAVVWFNLDKRREGELNFRLDSSESSLKAFNETFAVKPSPDDN
jgi:hypothetical protein